MFPPAEDCIFDLPSCDLNALLQDCNVNATVDALPTGCTVRGLLESAAAGVSGGRVIGFSRISVKEWLSFALVNVSIIRMFCCKLSLVERAFGMNRLGVTML